HVVLIVFLFHLLSSISRSRAPLALHSFPTRRSSDLSTKNILPNIFQRPHTLTHRTQQTISLNRPITHTKPHTSHNIAYMHYMAYTRLYYGYLVVRLYGCISLSCVSIYLYHINISIQTYQYYQSDKQITKHHIY